MICKVCGNPVRADERVCSHCGAPVGAREGGVGFWDMLDGPREQPAVAPQPNDAPVYTMSEDAGTRERATEPKEEENVSNTTRRSSLSMLPIMACAVLSLAALIGAAVMNIQTRHLLNELQETVAADQASLSVSISELSDHVGQLEQVVKANDAMASQLAVLVWPKQVSAPQGYQSDEGDALFSVLCSEGRVGSYTWERQLDDGTYEMLSFDEQTGVNERYGLALDEADDKSRTNLVAVGLTDQAAGTYRCVVSNLYGDTLTCTFELVLSTDGRRVTQGLPTRVSLSEAQDSSAAGNSSVLDAATQTPDINEPDADDDLGDELDADSSDGFSEDDIDASNVFEE